MDEKIYFKVIELFSEKGPRFTIEELARVEPVYVELPGWKEDITNVTSFEELPVNAQNYIKKIEELIHCPVIMFSVGPDRTQTIVLKEVF